MLGQQSGRLGCPECALHAPPWPTKQYRQHHECISALAHICGQMVGSDRRCRHCCCSWFRQRRAPGIACSSGGRVTLLTVTCLCGAGCSRGGRLARAVDRVGHSWLSDWITGCPGWPHTSNGTRQETGPVLAADAADAALTNVLVGWGMSCALGPRLG